MIRWQYPLISRYTIIQYFLNPHKGPHIKFIKKYLHSPWEGIHFSVSSNDIRLGEINKKYRNNR